MAHCIERGILKRGNAETNADVIWSCGHGLASPLITHPHFKDRSADTLIAAGIDMVLNGLLKR